MLQALPSFTWLVRNWTDKKLYNNYYWHNMHNIISRAQLSWLCQLKTCHTNTKISHHTTSFLLKFLPLTQHVFGWGISRVFGVFNNLWAQVALVFDEWTWQQGLGHSEPETGQGHWQSWTGGSLQAWHRGVNAQLWFLQQSTSGSTPEESDTPEKCSPYTRRRLYSPYNFLSVWIVQNRLFGLWLL